MQSKLIKSTLLAFAFLTLLFSSCTKDKSMSEQIVGSWEATSFMQNGTEMIGSQLETFSLDFGTYNGTEGIITFTTIEMDGDVERSSGSYVIANGDEMVTVSNDGEVIDFTTAVSDTNLTMTGTDSDGEVFAIVAKK